APLLSDVDVGGQVGGREKTFGQDAVGRGRYESRLWKASEPCGAEVGVVELWHDERYSKEGVPGQGRARCRTLENRYRVAVDGHAQLRRARNFEPPHEVADDRRERRRVIALEQHVPAPAPLDPIDCA